MAKSWKELTEDLKEIIEEISKLTKEAFEKGDVEKGLRLLSEFRKTVKTAGELNLIAGGGAIFEPSEEEEDIEKALGIEEELEEEPEEEEKEEPEEEELEEEEPEEEIEIEEEEIPEEETEEEMEKIIPFNLEDLLKGRIRRVE